MERDTHTPTFAVSEATVASILRQPPAHARRILSDADPSADILYNKTVIVHAYGPGDDGKTPVVTPTPVVAGKLRWWSLELGPSATRRLYKVALAHLVLFHMANMTSRADVACAAAVTAAASSPFLRELSRDCIEVWCRHYHDRKAAAVEAAPDAADVIRSAEAKARLDSLVRVTSSVEQAQQDMKQSAYLRHVKRRQWEAGVKGWGHDSVGLLALRPLPFAELEIAGREFREVSDRLNRRVGIGWQGTVNVVEMANDYVEAGAAFTLGRTVFVRPLHRPYAHEFVHVVQRALPDPFHKLYVTRLGFAAVPASEAMAYLRSPAVDNPDASLFSYNFSYAYDDFLTLSAFQAGLRLGRIHFDLLKAYRRPPATVPFLDHPGIPLDHPHEMLAHYISTD
jgi:hypothetical protein